ncbi:hypothetical protein LXL04_017047 [Taraxacum kok-saghyz]
MSSNGGISSDLGLLIVHYYKMGLMQHFRSNTYCDSSIRCSYISSTNATDWEYAAKEFVKRLPNKIVVYFGIMRSENNKVHHLRFHRETREEDDCNGDENEVDIMRSVGPFCCSGGCSTLMRGDISHLRIIQIINDGFVSLAGKEKWKITQMGTVRNGMLKKGNFNLELIRFEEDSMHYSSGGEENSLVKGEKGKSSVEGEQLTLYLLIDFSTIVNVLDLHQSRIQIQSLHVKDTNHFHRDSLRHSLPTDDAPSYTTHC